MKDMAIKIYTEEQAKLVDENSSELEQYQRIKAAGGVVLNDEGKILMIFRRGKWDLPKGKVEENEPIELCAERETMEETGLTKLELQKFLISTYHTYVDKKQLVLKDTHWFLFRAPGSQQLSPQVDEDITETVWADGTELNNYVSNTYLLIRDVLSEAKLIAAE